MQDTEFKQVNGNKQHRYSNVAATASVSIGEAQGRKAASPTQLVNRQSHAGLRKMGRATRAATAGILVALAIQGIGMLFDRAGVARVENHVLLNWLSLLFAPFSFISRMYDPDGPMAVSWSGTTKLALSNRPLPRLLASQPGQKILHGDSELREFIAHRPMGA